MSATQIFLALQEFEGEAGARRDAAQAGFLEWALSLPASCNAPFEARRALLHLEAIPNSKSAARLFVDYLRDASHQLPTPSRRGGASARRRVLH